MPKFRIDRLATLSIFHPFRRGFRGADGGIPILMYHSISEIEHEGVHPYYGTATAPQIFAEQMKFLWENGFTTLTLDAAVERLKGGTSRREKVVVITFDDGFEDFLARAFPILRQYRFDAVVFLPTAFIQDTSTKFKGIPCLTWTQVRDLYSQGVRFGSHTVNHPKLVSLRPVELERELYDSKETIEERLGYAVESFCYPYAFPETNSSFKQRIRALLERSGYRSAVTTIIGRAAIHDDPLCLPRLPVNSWDDSRLFRAKLEGGYDWIHVPQYLAKMIKRPADD